MKESIVLLTNLLFILMISTKELREFLDEKANFYNNSNFIINDPISIPHQFSKKTDIEIAGFLSASIAWGNRKAILKSANQLMAWMDYAPTDFIINATENDFEPFEKFIYRTFNGIDCVFFLKSLQNIYIKHNGLAAIFEKGFSQQHTVKHSIAYFRKIFFEIDHADRTEKHIANTDKNSAAKRMNMFLRWMVRDDNKGVDFGIWDFIPTSKLMIPLDVHSGNIARKLSVLTRKQNDWKAVDELMINLIKLDSNDPVKYDFALFGLGVNNDF